MSWILTVVFALSVVCPQGTVAVPFADPDRDGVYIEQPNLPAAYVQLVAPDGTRWDFPFGTYHLEGVVGQWHVCYTEDIHTWLDQFDRDCDGEPCPTDCSATCEKDMTTTTSTTTPTTPDTPTPTTTTASSSPPTSTGATGSTAATAVPYSIMRWATLHGPQVT